MASILGTTLLAYAGIFSAYSYISVVLHPVTGGDGTRLAELPLVWGIAATVGNLGAGYLSDRFGSYRAAVTALLVVAVDFLFLRWTSMHLVTAVLALVIWGLAG